jgi:transcriptional regulator with XRE-family HTH domain
MNDRSSSCSQSPKTISAFKLARLSAGFAHQRDLATVAGLTEMQICRIETGRWKPPAEIRQRLAAILNRPTWEILQ